MGTGDEEAPEDRDIDRSWPKDGDRLFLASTSTTDAYVTRDPSERFYRLPRGYKLAGDLLAGQAASEVADRSNLIYAALFCYRQAIELYLKWLISDFEVRGLQPRPTHDLVDNWKRFIGIVDERDARESLGLEAVGKLVAEMNGADLKADGFRFPTDLQQNPFGFGDRGIDLDNLRTVMQGLENFFECVYLAFSNEDDLRSEYDQSLGHLP